MRLRKANTGKAPYDHVQISISFIADPARSKKDLVFIEVRSHFKVLLSHERLCACRLPEAIKLIFRGGVMVRKAVYVKHRPFSTIAVY
jgi:hypothetical protein